MDNHPQDELLNHLRATRGQWVLTSYGLLRRFDNSIICPLMSWRDSEQSSESFIVFASRKGLTEEQIQNIIRAADNPKNDPIRFAMLEAAGLI